MPIYEYRCEKCTRTFSALQKIGATEKNTACPRCGSKAVKKLLSTFSCSAAEGRVYSPSIPYRSAGG